MHFIDAADIHVFTHCVKAPPLAEAQHHSASNLVMHWKYTTDQFLSGTATYAVIVSLICQALPLSQT